MAGDPALPAPIRAFADALAIHFSDETSRIVAVVVPRARIASPAMAAPWPVIVVYEGAAPELDFTPWRRDGVVRFGSIPLDVVAEPLAAFDRARAADVLVAGAYPDEAGNDAWARL
ncbi:MAG TPA: hypothetical protein VM889_13970 [Candidatus Thermoplasmatota archaeon]|nr:hypothetical protein [Candidatus Thermoplasmatota archaeon]